MTEPSSKLPSAASQQAVARRLVAAFERHYGSRKEVQIACAPGRINLLGGHTDYNEGYVLPATIDRAVYVAVRARRDETVRLRSLNFDDALEYSLSDRPDVSGPTWAPYVTGIIEAFRERGLLETGLEAVLYGNVPLGAGLSSSAALEVACALAIEAVTAFKIDAVEMARLCQHVEHTYAGVQCGIMDQFAARLGRAHYVLFLDCRTLNYTYAPLPLEETALVIVDSRVSRELAASKYNERRSECGEGVRYFQHVDEQISSLRDVPEALFEQHRSRLSEPVRHRVEHVIHENTRVVAGKERLDRHDWSDFGRLMYESHRSLRDLYEVSAPELDFIVDRTRQIDGVFGARMTGAGFGGCAVILARPGAISRLQQQLPGDYEEQFGQTPHVLVVRENLEAGHVYP